ncbi:hypothetical protein [Salegentibacter sp. Hel_I_6]|uniref:hypothetical protein n=1 Tax=Salegentibacter sp. Hel_I_6 TaxID=1250278 RepID=UPI00055E0D23|nr:hypothetical protein [Salegentibacter sp. Hel_I_6]
MIFYDLKSKPEIIQFHFTKLQEDWVNDRIKESTLNKTLKKFIEDNLLLILTGTPKDLNRINHTLKNHSHYKKSLDVKIRKIFDYENFSKKHPNKYDAFDLAKALDVRTCLYCNRMYTLTVKTGKKREDKITRPQFDHFIDKGKNPLLGLSIYNLVPSCVICNSTLKGKKQFNLSSNIHPFIDNIIDNYHFTYDTENIESLLGTDSEINVWITYNGLSKKKKVAASKSVEIFKINKIMSAHSEELIDLFNLRYRYSERYFEELIRAFDSVSLDVEDLYRTVFGSYYNSDQFSKRPFSKLKRDILEKLEIVLPQMMNDN